MFSTEMMESRQERVEIYGVETQIFGMLVSYAYTSEVLISKANVQVKNVSCPHLSLSSPFLISIWA